MSANQVNSNDSKGRSFRRKVVPGAMGIGKVEMIFKEKPKRRNKTLAIILYTLFLGTIYFSFGWSREYLKEKQLVPSVRGIFAIMDFIKLNYLTKIKTELSTIRVPDKSFEITRLVDSVRVSASNTNEVLFGQGYAHAIERLFQMEIYRRAAQGRLSEIFGNQTVYFDEFAATMDFHRLAEKDLESLDSSSQQLLNSYVNGINRYIEQEDSFALPIDFQISHGVFRQAKIERWEAVHSLAILRMLSYEWNPSQWEDQLRVHFSEQLTYSKEAMGVFFSDTLKKDTSLSFLKKIHSIGGTVIAVGKKHSATGNAILATDFHSTNHHQGYFFLNHLSAEDQSYNAEGFSFPGIPFVLVGKNDFLSWALNFNPNHQTDQIYIDSSLDLRSDLKDTHLTTLDVEQIRVYGLTQPLDFPTFQLGDCRDVRQIIDTSVLSVVLMNRYSHLFLCSQFFSHDFRGLSFFYRLNSAKSATELEVIMKDVGLPSSNLFFALTNGSVGVIESRSTVQAENQNVKFLSYQKWKKDFDSIRPASSDSYGPLYISDDAIISSHKTHHQRITQLLFDSKDDDNHQTCSSSSTDPKDSACSESEEGDIMPPVQFDALNNILTDDFSISSLQTASFMTRLIDNLTKHRYLLKFYTNFTDHNLLLLENIKSELIIFNGSASLNTNALFYIEGFHSFFLMALFKPLIPVEEFFLGSNVTALLRRSALDRYRRSLEPFVNDIALSPPSSPLPSHQSQISSWLKKNYWTDHLLLLNPLMPDVMNSVHSFDERNNKEVHYQIFFTQLLLNLLDWIELHHPLKFSLFENVAKKRTWGKVHAYQNSHAISKNFEVFDTMMQDGPYKKLRGSKDSIFHSFAPLNKFKLYSEEAFVCDSCLMSSMRMVVESNKSKNELERKGRSLFLLPVLSSRRKGSQYNGWNPLFFL